MKITVTIIKKKTCLFTPCRKRAPYIAYLTRCRQGLQTSQAHLERLLQRVLRDKEVANRYFTTVCVRILLEHMEAKMLDFIKGNSVLITLVNKMPSKAFLCHVLALLANICPRKQNIIVGRRWQQNNMLKPQSLLAEILIILSL